MAVDRATAADLMSFASERGALPMQVGAAIMLDCSDGFEPAELARQISDRSRAVPRLGQCLVAVPRGCGRPVWVDDTDRDAASPVETVDCPEPRGEEGVLALAADLVCRELPRDRPLWRAAVVTGVGPDQAALILVHHHVLGDGVAGLAVLSALADRAAVSPDVSAPDVSAPDVSA
ncbi:MAG: wax ester/triacylglycerol synthase domain-containing protein, partial [Lapillicoccus sp.]